MKMLVYSTQPIKNLVAHDGEKWKHGNHIFIKNKECLNLKISIHIQDKKKSRVRCRNGSAKPQVAISYSLGGHTLLVASYGLHTDEVI